MPNASPENNFPPEESISKTPFEALTEPDPPDEASTGSESFIARIHETAEKLLTDRAGRGDVKLLATAMRELRYCLKVFAGYRGKRKVTVFGSARTPPSHPAFQAAVEFGCKIADEGWMVITGAGNGIMEAGHIGAGRENSFGLNILLPFEQSANPIVQGDPKLMNLRYFFTRKLMFIKESDAVVLFPGGFGTHDEAFEALTLIQTGKSHPFPVVLVDEPGGNYWKAWNRFVDEEFLDRGYISAADKSLYRVTDSVDEAIAEVTGYYRVYHSMRYVKNKLIFRLQSRLSEAKLDRIRESFRDILVDGEFEQVDALPEEASETNLRTMPRLRFSYNRSNAGRLRQLIDLINGKPMPRSDKK